MDYTRQGIIMVFYNCEIHAKKHIRIRIYDEMVGQQGSIPIQRWLNGKVNTGVNVSCRIRE